VPDAYYYNLGFFALEAVCLGFLRNKIGVI
jgi:hypothetical protein